MELTKNQLNFIDVWNNDKRDKSTVLIDGYSGTVEMAHEIDTDRLEDKVLFCSSYWGNRSFTASELLTKYENGFVRVFTEVALIS